MGLHNLSDELKRFKVGFPREKDVARQILEGVAQHSAGVCTLQNLRGAKDLPSFTPHDAVGAGNKLDAPQVFYLANHFREQDIKNPLFKKIYHNYFVKPGYELHRAGQPHHQHWHDNRESTEDILENCAIDNAYSMAWEERLYNGGSVPLNKVTEKYLNSLKKAGKQVNPRKVDALAEICHWMESQEKFDVKVITNPLDFENIGMRDEDYEALKMRLRETVLNLEKPGWWNKHNGWDLQQYWN